MRIKLRYWFRLLTAFVVRFRVVLFGSVILGLLLFAIITYLLPRFVGKHVEYIGISGRYTTEDLPSSILNLIGEGLTKLDDQGEVVPGLAESWDHSDDGTVWTFHLKDGVSWHDGTPVSSDTIQYSFEDAEIDRPDSKTIVFKLSAPFSPFPVAVSKPTFKKGLLGTGDWKVVNLKLNSVYVQEITLVNTNGDKKIMKFYPSEDSTKTAFELGEIDEIDDILDTEPLSSWSTVKLTTTTKPDRVVAIFFNNEDDSLKGTDNKGIRQALSYAINKQDFGFTRALGPIPPSSWAYNSQIKDYAYDVDRAKELLKDTKDFSIDLTTIPTLLPTAEKVAKDWEAVGVKTNIQVVSVLPEKYQAFLAIYDMPLDPDQYSVWHTTQKETNISKYSNPRIDKLLEDGRIELDHENRKKIYLDFQRFLLEDAPAIFLYHPLSYTLTRK